MLLPYLKLAQEWLTRPKVMWTFLIVFIAILAAILGFGHHNAFYLISHDLILVGLFVTCACGLIVHYVYKLKDYIAFDLRMRHLATDEQEILATFVKKKSSTEVFRFDQPATNSLVDEGILKVATETGHVHEKGGFLYYTIKPAVLRKLLNHPRLLGKHAPPNP